MKRQSMQQFIENNITGENKDKLLKYYKEACHLDYMENRDYHKERSKKYYQEHKEELKEYYKKYYQEHKKLRKDEKNK